MHKNIQYRHIKVIKAIEGQWFHIYLENQRHKRPYINRNIRYWMEQKNLWKLNPCECGLFSRSQWPYSLHIFSLVSLVKKCATCKAIVTFQRGPIHTESTFTVFFFHSLTYITINVRHIQSSLLKYHTQKWRETARRDWFPCFSVANCLPQFCAKFPQFEETAHLTLIKSPHELLKIPLWDENSQKSAELSHYYHKTFVQ